MAFYSNNFPATYTPYTTPNQNWQSYMGNMPNQNYSMNNQPQQQSTGIIWVQGEAGAKSYLVAPNTTVQLWDSESQRIYIKSADASGMPSMKTVEYKFVEQNPGNSYGGNVIDGKAQEVPVSYATKDDIDAIKQMIVDLQRNNNEGKPNNKKGGN